MRTEALLTLAQLFSPAYPLGSFAYSHGLETAVASGWVTTGPEVRDWLDTVCREGTGRSDAILIRLAEASDDVAALNAEAQAFCGARERVIEAQRQGAAFAATSAEVFGIDVPPLMFPVAAGAVAQRLALDIDAVVVLYLHGFVSNAVAVAQRLLPIGQTEAQRIVAALHPACQQVAEASRDCGLDDLSSQAFLSDIAAMRHETQEVRLFQT